MDDATAKQLIELIKAQSNVKIGQGVISGNTLSIDGVSGEIVGKCQGDNVLLRGEDGQWYGFIDSGEEETQVLSSKTIRNYKRQAPVDKDEVICFLIDVSNSIEMDGVNRCMTILNNQLEGQFKRLTNQKIIILPFADSVYTPNTIFGNTLTRQKAIVHLTAIVTGYDSLEDKFDRYDPSVFIYGSFGISESDPNKDTLLNAYKSFWINEGTDLPENGIDAIISVLNSLSADRVDKYLYVITDNNKYSRNENDVSLILNAKFNKLYFDIVEPLDIITNETILDIDITPTYSFTEGNYLELKVDNIKVSEKDSTWNINLEKVEYFNWNTGGLNRLVFSYNPPITKTITYGGNRYDWDTKNYSSAFTIDTVNTNIKRRSGSAHLILGSTPSYDIFQNRDIQVQTRYYRDFSTSPFFTETLSANTQYVPGTFKYIAYTTTGLLADLVEYTTPLLFDPPQNSGSIQIYIVYEYQGNDYYRYISVWTWANYLITKLELSVVSNSYNGQYNVFINGDDPYINAYRIADISSFRQFKWWNLTIGDTVTANLIKGEIPVGSINEIVTEKIEIKDNKLNNNNIVESTSEIKLVSLRQKNTSGVLRWDGGGVGKEFVVENVNRFYYNIIAFITYTIPRYNGTTWLYSNVTTYRVIYPLTKYYWSLNLSATRGLSARYEYSKFNGVKMVSTGTTYTLPSFTYIPEPPLPEGEIPNEWITINSKYLYIKKDNVEYFRYPINTDTVELIIDDGTLYQDSLPPSNKIIYI